jgi:hypothetical protein
MPVPQYVLALAEAVRGLANRSPVANMLAEARLDAGAGPGTGADSAGLSPARGCPGGAVVLGTVSARRATQNEQDDYFQQNS